MTQFLIITDHFPAQLRWSRLRLSLTQPIELSRKRYGRGLKLAVVVCTDQRLFSVVDRGGHV